MPGSEPRAISGIVVSGRGEGEIYVNIYAREFERRLGFRPYPGTLNVKLDPEETEKRIRLLSGTNPIVIPPPRGIPGLVRVHCHPAVIRGVKVFIVEPQVPGYDASIVELISQIYLREALGLKDGDMVEIILLAEHDYP